jgi:hypothetical protein
MAIPRSCRWWTIATFFAGLCQATTAAGADTGPVRLLDPAVAPDVVWSHAASACSNTDYSDVPVRPFYGHARGQPGRTLYWFASNSTGYLATIGVPPADGADILAKMVRVIDTNRQCATWITSGPYTEAPITPANGVPQSYNTGQWMVAPFTPDGRRVFALVHNEFHGELTAPRMHPRSTARLRRQPRCRGTPAATGTLSRLCPSTVVAPSQRRRPSRRLGQRTGDCLAVPLSAADGEWWR